MGKPEFRPLEPEHYRRSVFGGHVRRDDGPSGMRMEVGAQRPDGSVVVGMIPVDPVAGQGVDEAIRELGGVPISLDTGGDEVLDPSIERHRAQEDLRRAMVELDFTDDELAAFVASFD